MSEQNSDMTLLPVPAERHTVKSLLKKQKKELQEETANMEKSTTFLASFKVTTQALIKDIQRNQRAC